MLILVMVQFFKLHHYPFFEKLEKNAIQL